MKYLIWLALVAGCDSPRPALDHAQRRAADVTGATRNPTVVVAMVAKPPGLARALPSTPVDSPVAHATLRTSPRDHDKAARVRESADDVPAPVVARVASVLGDDALIKPRLGGDRFEAISATKLELVLRPDGAIRATEVELPLEALPALVLATATSKGTPIEATLVVVASGAVLFEVAVETAAGKFEYTIDPAGKIAATLDETEDPDEEAE